ncbi:MAG TPA: hypothetical protein VHI93_01745 [Candidatus Thermoplasmatota archaeon]|nr:hypothetical protein [Candidatus Thermoplasmatota archaeon]
MEGETLGGEPSKARPLFALLALATMLAATAAAVPNVQAAPPPPMLPEGGCSPITQCITCPTGPCLVTYTPCGTGRVGYIVNGKPACASVCPSGTYGAWVNNVGACTPLPTVTYCGTGYVGARVNGVGACQAIPTVTLCSGGTYGARVNGVGACQSLPTVQLCSGGSVGASVNGVGTCYTPGPTGPCPSGQVGYEVGGVNGCRTPPPSCGPGNVGTPPACTPLFVPNGQSTACAMSSEIAETANIDLSPARLANCFAGPGGGPNAGVGRCDLLGTACAAVAGIAVDGCVSIHVTAEGRMRGQFMMVFPIDGAANVEGQITSCMSLSVV